MKCSKCKAKTIDNDHWCKACRSAHSRAWYLENKAQKIKQANDKANERRIECRLHIYEYLKENPCVDCGEKDVVVLEFDHLPQFTKKFNISNHTGYINLGLLEEEIKKCEVVCRNCHKRRTSKRSMHFRYRMQLLDNNLIGGTGTQTNGVCGSETISSEEGLEIN